VLRRLVPRDRRFYALFDRHAELCVEGVTALAKLLSEVRDPNGRVREIEAIEKRADTVVDDTLALVRRSLLPPFPRRSIHALINRLDDILDLTEDASAGGTGSAGRGQVAAGGRSTAIGRRPARHIGALPGSRRI
jgi:uncharacterized protein Yka (UPF0111/DUF47 family)